MPDQQAAPLPPVPDVTGEPRPPTAPHVPAPWTKPTPPTVHHHHADDRILWLGDGMESLNPSEKQRRLEHPLLEQVLAPPPTALERLQRAAAVGASTFVVPTLVGAILAVVLALSGEGITTTTVVGGLIVVAIIATFPFLGFLLFNKEPERIRAGAHAVHHDSYYETNYLWLYELTAVTITTTRKGPKIRLAGRFDVPQTVRLPLNLLQANPQLWDLVYNGIRHSAANGADIDDHTRRLLQLPPADPPTST